MAAGLVQQAQPGQGRGEEGESQTCSFVFALQKLIEIDWQVMTEQMWLSSKCPREKGGELQRLEHLHYICTLFHGTGGKISAVWGEEKKTWWCHQCQSLMSSGLHHRSEGGSIFGPWPTEGEDISACAAALARGKTPFSLKLQPLMSLFIRYFWKFILKNACFISHTTKSMC